MTKKVYDVIPPKKIEQEQSFDSGKVPIKIKESLFVGKPDKPVGSIKALKSKRKSKLKGAFLKTLAVCIMFIIIVVGLNLFLFSEAKVEIYPEMETVFLTESVTISIGKEVEGLVIKGEMFKDLKNEEKEFPATGKSLQEGKAKGIIKVYNEHSTSSQGLLANTRFLSADGKLFKTTKKEVIPGGTYEGSKFIPGEIDIEIEAAESGEEYNIPASTFVIPGFSGTPKYTNFYGKSSEPMKGGFEGDVPEVTQDDLDKAKVILKEKLEKQSMASLNAAIPNGFILVQETIIQEMLEQRYSVEAGSGSEMFKAEIKVGTKGVIFDESDAKDLAKTLLRENMAEGKTIQEESLELTYSFESKELSETDTGKVVMIINIQAKVYSDINLSEVEKSLLGKTIQEVKVFLEDKPEIVKVKINPGPFWRKRIPDNMDKVEVSLSLD